MEKGSQISRTHTESEKSQYEGRVPLTRPDLCTKMKLPVKLTLQPSSWPDLKDETIWIEIHEHSNSRKQTANLSPQRKHYNFGRILFIPSQKEMNGPMSRWIHRESSIPYFHLPLPLAKRVPKVSPSALSQSRPSVSLVNPGTLNLSDYFPLGSKTLSLSTAGELWLFTFTPPAI